jgi:hypothetical protein
VRLAALKALRREVGATNILGVDQEADETYVYYATAQQPGAPQIGKAGPRERSRGSVPESRDEDLMATTRTWH